MDNLFNLNGKVALVTGASSGLGRHMAMTLARMGAHVALAARRTDKLEIVASEIAKENGTAIPVTMDVNEPASVLRAVSEAEKLLGMISICVNNAGIAIKEDLANPVDAAWERTIATNLSGANYVARAAAEAMSARSVGGTIINVSSILGLRPSARVPAYSAAKAAILSLTQSMALAYARRSVRVNAIAPGYIETDLNRDFLSTDAGVRMVERIAVGRFGQPGDLDGALLLLSSDASKYMTGTTVVIDGGHSLAFL